MHNARPKPLNPRLSINKFNCLLITKNIFCPNVWIGDNLCLHFPSLGNINAFQTDLRSKVSRQAWEDAFMITYLNPVLSVSYRVFFY